MSVKLNVCNRIVISRDDPAFNATKDLLTLQIKCDGPIKGLTVTADPDANVKGYVINPDVFEYLETQGEGAGGEIQLTDALKRMTKDGKPMYAYDFKGTRYDVGSQIGFVQANIEYALRDDRLKKELSQYIQELSKDIEGTIHFD